MSEGFKNTVKENALGIGLAGTAAFLILTGNGPDKSPTSRHEGGSSRAIESVQGRTPEVDQFVVLQQTELQRYGYYDGKIDGIAGPKTRAAQRAYDAAQGGPSTKRADAGRESDDYKPGAVERTAISILKIPFAIIGEGGHAIVHEIVKGDEEDTDK